MSRVLAFDFGASSGLVGFDELDFVIELLSRKSDISSALSAQKLRNPYS